MEGGGVGDVYGQAISGAYALESSMIRLGETRGLDLGPNFK
jgi:hypothetical protein